VEALRKEFGLPEDDEGEKPYGNLLFASSFRASRSRSTQAGVLGEAGLVHLGLAEQRQADEAAGAVRQHPERHVDLATAAHFHPVVHDPKAL
jgi:hypothetical protein